VLFVFKYLSDFPQPSSLTRPQFASRLLCSSTHCLVSSAQWPKVRRAFTFYVQRTWWQLHRW
jgi:hypothetical protein